MVVVGLSLLVRPGPRIFRQRVLVRGSRPVVSKTRKRAGPSLTIEEEDAEAQDVNPKTQNPLSKHSSPARSSMSLLARSKSNRVKSRLGQERPNPDLMKPTANPTSPGVMANPLTESRGANPSRIYVSPRKRRK